MSDKPHNEPAFPRADHGHAPTQDGMSLRDYFAGQALAGMSAHWLIGWLFMAWLLSNRVLALEAYKIADAMLAEREQ